MTTEQTLHLSDDAMLELEMANARGGNDWLEALEERGNDLLHDALLAHRLVRFVERIASGKYGPAAAIMREAKELLGT